MDRYFAVLAAVAVYDSRLDPISEEHDWPREAPLPPDTYATSEENLLRWTYMRLTRPPPGPPPSARFGTMHRAAQTSSPLQDLSRQLRTLLQVPLHWDLRHCLSHLRLGQDVKRSPQFQLALQGAYAAIAPTPTSFATD